MMMRRRSTKSDPARSMNGLLSFISNATPNASLTWKRSSTLESLCTMAMGWLVSTRKLLFRALDQQSGAQGLCWASTRRRHAQHAHAGCMYLRVHIIVNSGRNQGRELLQWCRNRGELGVSDQVLHVPRHIGRVSATHKPR